MPRSCEHFCLLSFFFSLCFLLKRRGLGAARLSNGKLCAAVAAACDHTGANKSRRVFTPGIITQKRLRSAAEGGAAIASAAALERRN